MLENEEKGSYGAYSSAGKIQLNYLQMLEEKMQYYFPKIQLRIKNQ